MFFSLHWDYDLRFELCLKLGEELHQRLPRITVASNVFVCLFFGSRN